MLRSVDPLPAGDLSNGWSAVLPPRQPHGALQGDINVDWLVVGAGYAGVAAARQLARLKPDASIAVVEAGVVGENASGRNSGFAIDLPHSPGTSAEAIEVGRRAIRVGRFAIEELDALIRENQIDCNWERRGRYHAAVTREVAQAKLKAYEANLIGWREPYEWVCRDGLEDRLGTDYYNAAIYTSGTYLLNPSALIRGLADSLPEQVRLFENSAVIKAEFEGDMPYVCTSKGRISAKKIILAVNAYSQAFGVYRECQVPIILFASLSPVLTAEQLAGLGTSSSWGVTPAESVAGSTLRLTCDKRLMIRQGFEYSPTLRTSELKRSQARAMNKELLQRRFPSLSSLGLEHFWMGWLAVSRNHAPAFGQIAEHVYAASCCNGSGIVRHTAAGMLIAEVAAGRSNPLIEDFLSQGTANYIPPRPFRDIGVGLTMLWEQWKGRREQ
jgi:glycine/D-amino acid oxidase-like deaminating enzyme